MRYLTGAMIMLFFATTTQSQTYEIGAFLGGANYIGDVGSTNYIAPKSLAFGGILKWNRSTRHSFRATLTHTELEADDANASENRRQNRGYEFKNSLTEGSLGIEYTFWEWNLHNHKTQATPYLYSGITGFLTRDMYLRGERLIKRNRKIDFAVPMVLGIKGSLGGNWVLAAEIGARYTFTDNLDGSNPEEFEGGKSYPSFGNPNTNDWYMFSGITITYTFGRKPCYCKF